MRLILELEETDDVQRLERVITLLKPYFPKIQYSEKMRRIQAFLDFAERESIAVEKLAIPDREARNAR